MNCLNNMNRLQISNETMMKLLTLYEYKGKDYYFENLQGVIEEGYNYGLKYAEKDACFITCNLCCSLFSFDVYLLFFL